MQRPLVIGTRGSPLALAQARSAQALIAAEIDPARAPDEIAPIRVVKTTGDQVLDRVLADAGGKGLFTKELEEALIDGRVDVAVHSMKDVPTRLPPGLVLAAVLEREDPRDVLITADGRGLEDIRPGAVIGTASVRRRAQALALRPDCRTELLRGNVASRLSAVDLGRFDATFLALAGLRRLGLADRPLAILEPDAMLPSAAQGAVCLQARAGDAPVLSVLRPLNHLGSAICVAAERGFLDALDGSCRTPIAALARWTAPSDGVVGSLRLRGALYALEGTHAWSADQSLRLDAEDAHQLEAHARDHGRGLGEEVRRQASQASDGPLGGLA